MGELSFYGNGLLLFSNSQHIHRPVWLSKSCCYWSCSRVCWTPFKFFCKVKAFIYIQSIFYQFYNVEVMLVLSAEYEEISSATLYYLLAEA